jgi:hypothetical protein
VSGCHHGQRRAVAEVNRRLHPSREGCVASAVDDEGEQLYPRKWNHDFLDLPVVEKSKQNTPCFSSLVMTALSDWEYERERTVFILCGAAGLRIGEALGLEIDKHLSLDFHQRRAEVQAV